MKEKPLAGEKTSFTEFSGGHGSLLPNLLVWASFLLVTAFVVYGWLNTNMQKGQADELRGELGSVEAQLDSAEWQDIKKQVTSFDSAIDALIAVRQTHEKKNLLLQDIYTYFTNDVVISSLSLSSSGELSVTGNTANYRKVADLMVALKSSDKIGDVKVSNLSLEQDSESTDTAISFVLNAEVLPSRPAEVVDYEADIESDIGSDSYDNLDYEDDSDFGYPEDEAMETLSPSEAYDE